MTRKILKQKCFWTFLLSLQILLNLNTSLFAASGDEKSEPVWVMSWAGFVLLVGVVVFFSAFVKRGETCLSYEEFRETEEIIAKRLHQKKRIKMGLEETSDDGSDEDEKK